MPLQRAFIHLFQINLPLKNRLGLLRPNLFFNPLVTISVRLRHQSRWRAIPIDITHLVLYVRFTTVIVASLYSWFYHPLLIIWLQASNSYMLVGFNISHHFFKHPHSSNTYSQLTNLDLWGRSDARIGLSSLPIRASVSRESNTYSHPYKGEFTYQFNQLFIYLSPFWVTG